MARSNDVFKVLVPSGTEGLLATGKTLEDLKPGQLGIFNYDDDMSIDASSNVRDFYFAVGIDRDNDNVSEDFNFSAGQFIQAKNMRYVQKVEYIEPKPQISVISDFKGDCEKDFTIKVDVLNIKTLRRLGYQKFSKVYNVTTGCCEKCATCESGDCIEIALLMAQAIENDADNLFEVVLLDKDDAVITKDDAVAIQTANVAKDPADRDCIKIQLTTKPVEVSAFCGIPSFEYKAKQTTIEIQLLDGFLCNGKVEVTQEAQFENASGKQVREKEFYAVTKTDNIYQVSGATGLPFNKMEYFADPNEKYTEISFTYDFFGRSAWKEYLNNIATIVAIPESNGALVTSLEDFANKVAEISNITPIV